LARVRRREYSEPVVREHVRVRTRDFFDGPNSVYEDAITVERPAREPSNLPPDVQVLRVSEAEAQRIRERLASSDEYEIVADRPVPKPARRDNDWYEDESRRSRHERRRRRRSQRSVDLTAANYPDGYRRPQNLRSPGYMEAPRVLPHVRAPSPPPVGRRRSGRHSFVSRQEHEDVDIRRTSQPEDIDRRGRPVVVGSRATSRSKSRGGSRWDAPFGGRPPASDSETIEMQEQIQGPPPVNEDYDWYDSYGQRVKVREI
jgi:hypothetical protein